jgi:hypothetical protein
MDITITIVGGYAGLRLVSVIDTDALPTRAPDAVAAALSVCMDHVAIPDGRARDARTIGIEAGGRSTSFAEHLAPDAWSVIAGTMPPGRAR